MNMIEQIVKNIKYNEPMSKHTTFKVGGPADVFAEPEAHELLDLINYLRDSETKYTVIGNGSNLLVGDGGIRGVVVMLGDGIADIHVDRDKLIPEYMEEPADLIYAGAGALLSRVANEAAANSLAGMEFASGIPGSVGGGAAMNAGAYGGEMKDIVLYVNAIHDGQFVKYSCEEMDFSYRHSRILGTDDIVTGVCIKLSSGDESEIREKMSDFNHRRADKQPINLPSAGSTFKRPEGYFAGKLIEDAGLRGYRVGGACVSEKHCGFVVNDQGATAADIKRLIEDVQKKVFEDAGVHLETEVRMIGEF